MTKQELYQISQDHPILFFDGVCGFCTKSLDWIIKADDKEVFRYCTLQDELGQGMRLEIGRAEDMDTVIGLYQGEITTKTDVTIMICNHLGGGYKIFGAILKVIPSGIRNIGYNLVAKYRYHIMGKKEECYVPTPSLKARFVCS